MKTAPLHYFSAIFAAAALFSLETSKADVVYDDISDYENGVSGATVTSSGSTPNTFMGGGYVLTPGTVDITGFDFYPVNLTGTTYTGLKINFYVWGGVNTGTVNATTPAFNNLLGSYSFTAPGTFTSGYYYSFENAASPGSSPGLTLPTPLAISRTTIGITINIQGTTDGTTYNSINNLTSVITYGTAPTVGSDVFNGYYRNANSEANGNFTSALRTLTEPDQGLAMRVYGDIVPVPEPTTMALLAASGLGLLALRRQRA
jgi:hypothetical protein